MFKKYLDAYLNLIPILILNQIVPKRHVDNDLERPLTKRRSPRRIHRVQPVEPLRQRMVPVLFRLQVRQQISPLVKLPVADGTLEKLPHGVFQFVHRERFYVPKFPLALLTGIRCPREVLVLEVHADVAHYQIALVALFLGRAAVRGLHDRVVTANVGLHSGVEVGNLGVLFLVLAQSGLAGVTIGKG